MFHCLRCSLTEIHLCRFQAGYQFFGVRSISRISSAIEKSVGNGFFDLDAGDL